MNQEPDEQEEWIDTMTAAKRFRVTTPTLYDLAYAEPPVVETKRAPWGRMREKLLFKVSDLQKWDESRKSHWKEKSKKRSEAQGRPELAIAL